jgi:hypothetical protein
MEKKNDTDGGQDASDIKALAPLIKAYIDKHVQDAIKQHEDSQSKPKRWRNSWRSASPITKASLILSAFVAVSTIAYTAAAWRTLIVMRQISSDSTQQTDKLIDAASQIKSAAWYFKGSAQGIDGNLGNAVGKLQGQVDQVKRTADAANESLVTVQRAFVFPTVVQSPAYTSDGKTQDGVQIQFVWQNTGSTPTRNLVIKSYIEHAVFPGNGNGKASITPDPKPHEEIRAFIGPKGTASLSPDEIPLSLLKAIFDSSTPLHFRGEAMYQDVFDRTKQHITKYCYQVSTLGRYSAFDNPKWTYSPVVRQCDTGNCTDDECKAQPGAHTLR